MKFREKYAVKIDLYDAFAGGLFLYFSTYLIAFAFGSLIAFVWGIINPGGLPDFFQNVTTEMQPWLSGDTMPIVLALVLAIALFTFLLMVLFEEHYFSKHERSTKDLIGIGLVWGSVFIAAEAIMNSGLQTLNQSLGVIYLPYGIKAFTSDIFFWPLVVYVVMLPWFFHYSKRVKARGK